MPSPVTTDLTVEDIEAHIRHWRSQALDAPTPARKAVAITAQDQWLDLLLARTGT